MPDDIQRPVQWVQVTRGGIVQVVRLAIEPGELTPLEDFARELDISLDDDDAD